MITDKTIQEFRTRLADARLDETPFGRMARVILRQGCGSEPSREMAGALQRKNLLHYFEPFCKAWEQFTGQPVNVAALIPAPETPKLRMPDEPKIAARGKAVGCSKTSSGKWKAKILVDGKFLHLGVFTSLIDAQLAFNAAARANPGKNGRTLNFVVPENACTPEPKITFRLTDERKLAA